MVYHYCFFFSGVAQGLTTFSVRCLWLNVLVMYCLHVITAYWNHRETNGGKYLYKFITRESSISITTKKGWGKHRLDTDKLFPFRIDLFLCFCFAITFLVSGVVNDNIYNNDNNNNYVSFYIIIFNFEQESMHWLDLQDSTAVFIFVFSYKVMYFCYV